MNAISHGAAAPSDPAGVERVEAAVTALGGVFDL